LPILDPNADKLSNPDRWMTLFNNLKRFYEIPNNKIESTALDEDEGSKPGSGTRLPLPFDRRDE
jgi:hypothetical protein